MDTLKIAVVQIRHREEAGRNVEAVEHWVREAASRGARLIVPPELFESDYFCKRQTIDNFSRARELRGHPTLERMQKLAAELSVVLPVSFFEREGPRFYNSLATFDVDGTLLGVYRKSHIPDGPGYQEKYYFRPGDTGFKVWHTAIGRVGVAICWDQWFPEVARELVLREADVLVYPTAIGSEPTSPDFDTKDMWQRAMAGHAACNVVPVVAANRTGTEEGQVFYGSSFITDHLGAKLRELGREEEGIGIASVDLKAARTERHAFGFFRDRRPELYVETARFLRTPGQPPG